MAVLAEIVAERRMENLLLPTAERKTVKQIAIDAGLSPSYAGTGQIMKTKAAQDVVARWRTKTSQIVQKKTALALKALTAEKLQDESARDLMAIVDTGIKNVQLLTGGATENINLAVMLQSLEDNTK